MNLQNIFNQIEKTDPEIYERLGGRRNAMKDFARLAGKVSVAALPIALGSMLKKAYAVPPPSNILEVLNFALQLEYLEAGFYEAGLAAADLIPAGAARTAIGVISAHETAHVNYLKTAITNAGGTPIAKPAMDFTANNAFPDVFDEYDVFLAVAQTFEDTGVRAYKGQAGALKADNAVLTVALNIHSVEARHASHIRSMRKARGASVKPWITLKDTGGIGAAVQASYNGEELTTQAEINIVNINGKSISAEAASEAFDEPLSYDEVIAIVAPFFPS